MDPRVLPISQKGQHGRVALRVVHLEGIERLVGEHDAEAEGVVGAVALEHGDARLRPGLLREDREVEAGRAAADDVNLHSTPPPRTPRIDARRAAGFILGLKYLD